MRRNFIVSILPALPVKSTPFMRSVVVTLRGAGEEQQCRSSGSDSLSRSAIVGSKPAARCAGAHEDRAAIAKKRIAIPAYVIARICYPRLPPYLAQSCPRCPAHWLLQRAVEQLEILHALLNKVLASQADNGRGVGTVVAALDRFLHGRLARALQDAEGKVCQQDTDGAGAIGKRGTTRDLNAYYRRRRGRRSSGWGETEAGFLSQCIGAGMRDCSAS